MTENLNIHIRHHEPGKRVLEAICSSLELMVNRMNRQGRIPLKETPMVQSKLNIEELRENLRTMEEEYPTLVDPDQITSSMDKLELLDRILSGLENMKMLVKEEKQQTAEALSRFSGWLNEFHNMHAKR